LPQTRAGQYLLAACLTFPTLRSQIIGNFGSYMPTSAETTPSNNMGYWIRFAATGDPNGSGAVAWPQYEVVNDSMLPIDVNQVAINGYNNPQCDYFSTLPQP
jgi:para-nitrobenzyl esterase